MNDKIDSFIKSLESQLRDCPSNEKDEAIQYYREYLSDALESGEDPDLVMRKMGSTEKIAAMIRMETSIAKARKSPGVRNYGGVMKNTFRIVTTPFSMFSLSIFVLLTASIFILFFAMAFCTALCAIMTLAVSVHEITKMPGEFLMEIMGTLGMGLMVAGIFMFLTLSFYKLTRLFIRLSVWFIDKILKKPKQNPLVMEKRTTLKSHQTKVAIWVFSAISATGLLLFAVSGLPMRYFTIFNSIKPENIEIQSYQMDMDEIDDIFIEAVHSIVTISEDSGNEVRFAYEKSDWLDGDFQTEGKEFRFRERTNGRLPFFDLVSLHESLTELRISIPKEYDGKITIKSIGGHVIVSNPSYSLQVKTMNGRVEVDIPRIDLMNITAKNKNGGIYVNGIQMGERADEGTQYQSATNTERTMELETTNGDIHINSR